MPPLLAPKPVRELSAASSPDTTQTKRCCTCHEAQPLEAFHKARAEPDGRQPRCKACTRRADKARFAADPVYFAEKASRWAQRNASRRREIQRACEDRSRAKHPEKVRATQALRNAIARGKLARGACDVCGAPAAQAHHEDYDRPLDVRWLCPMHHSAEHRRARRVVP